MKSLEELRQFYNSVLMPDLQALEKQRRSVFNNIIYTAAGAFGVAFVIILITAANAPALPCFIFPIFGAVAVTALAGWFYSKGYKSDFKMAIIERIVKFLDSGLDYDPHGYISKSEFVNSKIFHTKPNRYKGDDLVWGKLGHTQLKFSELNARHESGSGKNRRVRTVFKGLFFIGDFNKHFHGRTVVLPDTSEKLFGRLGQKFQEWNIARDDLVKLEDPDFEREFVVYSTDQIEARYILSTSLMRRILDFKHKAGKKIHLSFVGSRVHVAVSYTRDLFEPRIFRTLLDFGPIREYFQDLSSAVGIVEDLNLNTRIWTKN